MQKSGSSSSLGPGGLDPTQAFFRQIQRAAPPSPTKRHTKISVVGAGNAGMAIAQTILTQDVADDHLDVNAQDVQLEPSKTVIDPNFENQIVGGLGKLESMGQASALLPEEDVYKTSSSSGSSVQPPPSHTVIDLNPPMKTSVQPPPSQIIIDQESPGGNLVPPPPSQPIVDRERPPNPINWAAEWQNTILTLCSTTATGIAIQSMEKEFQFPPSFHWLSLANSLTFSALFVAKFVGRKSPAAVKVLEQFAVFLAVTIFFLAVAIPLPLHFKYSACAIYAVTMIIVFICEIL